MILGMSRTDGSILTGLDQIRQSIVDILTTPKGTRVMRRDYGSTVPDLLDRPQTPDLIVDLYAAIADALRLWEPRVRVRRIRATFAATGRAVIDLLIDILADGKTVTIEGIEL